MDGNTSTHITGPIGRTHRILVRIFFGFAEKTINSNHNDKNLTFLLPFGVLKDLASFFSLVCAYVHHPWEGHNF
jgi:hypothetical protein